MTSNQASFTHPNIRNKVTTKPCYKPTRKFILVIKKTDFPLMGYDNEITFTRWVHNLGLLGGSQTDATRKKRKDTSYLLKTTTSPFLFYKVRLNQNPSLPHLLAFG